MLHLAGPGCPGPVSSYCLQIPVMNINVCRLWCSCMQVGSGYTHTKHLAVRNHGPCSTSMQLAETLHLICTFCQCSPYVLDILPATTGQGQQLVHDLCTVAVASAGPLAPGPTDTRWPPYPEENNSTSLRPHSTHHQQHSGTLSTHLNLNLASHC